MKPQIVTCYLLCLNHHLSLFKALNGAVCFLEFCGWVFMGLPKQCLYGGFFLVYLQRIRSLEDNRANCPFQCFGYNSFIK